MNSLLQKESIVALVGMGGIGKTTLSLKMYHLFHNQYETFSFFEDAKLKDINNVKEKLRQDLCDKKLCKDDDVDKYLDQIKQCMISKKQLVVVDDVDMKKNLRSKGKRKREKNKSDLKISNWQELGGSLASRISCRRRRPPARILVTNF
jgi:predicted ATP-dependent serine protease